MMAATSSAASNRAPTDTVSPYKRRRTISNAGQDVDPLSDCISPLIDPHESELLPRGAESPRSRVAERLRGLQLFSPTNRDVGEDPMMSNVHDDFPGEARAYFEKQPDDNDLYLPSRLHDHNDYTTTSYQEPAPISFRNSRGSLSSSFSSSSSSSPTFLKSSSFPNPSHFRITKPKRRLSSPPPPIQIPTMKFAGAVAGEEEALAVWNGTSISWPQQSFNTKSLRGKGVVEFGSNDDGGEEDEDDGEGVNGIGYRPTPAVALARRQRRRQQVSEWKAREAREARQKRFVKRRGVGDGGGGGGRRGGGDLGVERVVRFAGVS